MAKNVYKTISANEKKFARMTGLKKELFDKLHQQVTSKIAEHHQSDSLSRRGKKSEMDIANKLLMTLCYYRNYHTYLTLSELFDVSEGQANKVFHKMSMIMVQVLSVGSRKRLSSKTIKAVLIDASEQRIERPMKRQKQYYSGKKNVIPSKPN